MHLQRSCIVCNTNCQKEICEACLEDNDGGFNFGSSLLRLQAKSSTREELRDAVEKEASLERRIGGGQLGKERPTTEAIVAMNIVARSLRAKVPDDAVPLMVAGDGDCMFRAVSVHISGDQSLSTELRWRTAVELVSNSEYYDKQLPAYYLVDDGTVFGSIAARCVRPKSYAGVGELMAVCTVVGLQLAIHLVHNPNTGSSQDLVFSPRGLANTSERIRLLWSTTHSDSGIQLPNHFSPVVAIPSQDQHDTAKKEADESTFKSYASLLAYAEDPEVLVGIGCPQKPTTSVCFKSLCSLEDAKADGWRWHNRGTKQIFVDR